MVEGKSKMKIWKLFYIHESDNELDVFHNIELIPEDKLWYRLYTAVCLGQLCEETIEKYKLKEKNLLKFASEKIAEIFEKDGYAIESVEV